MCCRKRAGICLQFRLLGQGWERRAEQESRRAAVQTEAHCHLPSPFLTNWAKAPPAVIQHLLEHPSQQDRHRHLPFDFSDLQHPLGSLKTLTLCFPFHPASLAAQGGLQLSEVSNPSISGSITHLPSNSGSATPPHCSWKPVPTWSAKCCSASWPASTVVLRPRGFCFKANIPGYVQVVCCCDIQSLNNFWNITQLPKHTAQSGNHDHACSVPTAGSVAQGSWTSALRSEGAGGKQSLALDSLLYVYVSL